MREAFWPFSRRAAFAGSAVLVPVLVLAVLIAGEQEYAGLGDSTWPVLVAALVGLIPIFALVLGGVDSVQAAGVKVAFTAVRDAVTKAAGVSTSALIERNLGVPPGQVEDSGSDTVIQALSSVAGNTAVVVDLQEGEAWWSTRLLLLASGAARRHNPKAIVFVRAEPGRPQAFIGWADPAEVLRRLLLAEPALQAAHWRADRQTLLWRLSTPLGPDSDTRTTLWPAAAAPYVDHPDQFVPERLLRDELRTLEAGDRDFRVTVGRLQDYLGSVLHTQSVDKDDDEAWLTRIVEGTADYIAITSKGQFVDLAPRSTAVNALLLSLFDEDDATTQE